MSLTQLVDIWFILTSMISKHSDTGGEIHLPQKHHMLISISNLLCYIDPLNSLFLVAQKVILECVGKICISIFHLNISHAYSLIFKGNEMALKNKQTKITNVYTFAKLPKAFHWKCRVLWRRCRVWHCPNTAGFRTWIQSGFSPWHWTHHRLQRLQTPKRISQKISQN